jgi:FAD dependent oxidoreductase TIGR03364
VYDVAVIGAGVLGAFHAYFACRKGLRTLLLERGGLPRDASVRNFGMVVPSAMPPGDWHRRARDSTAIYQELAEHVPFPLARGGTQYLATTPAEVAVLQEFIRVGPGQGYPCRLLDGRQSAEANPAVDPQTCLASLHFAEDLRLEPAALFRALVPWLVRACGCQYAPYTVAVGVEVEGGACRVRTADGRTFHAGHVFVCPGADLRTLFPERFRGKGLLRCKLQMLRTAPEPGLHMPTALASGLTLRRYDAFRELCPQASRLLSEPIDPELERQGVHVLLVQDADGSVVVGDSHQYTDADADDVDDGLDTAVEELILREARRLVRLPHWDVARRWYGVYSLLLTAREAGKGIIMETLEGRIHLVTGIGGKGMTVGPGLARESIERLG